MLYHFEKKWNFTTPPFNYSNKVGRRFKGELEIHVDKYWIYGSSVILKFLRKTVLLFSFLFCIPELWATLRIAFNEKLGKTGRPLNKQEDTWSNKTRKECSWQTHLGLCRSLRKALNFGNCIKRTVSVIYIACRKVECVCSCYNRRYILFRKNANIMLILMIY